jgi:excisionase family DNA binding protein
MKEDLLEGADQAAAFTGLPARKIYRLVESGHLPCVKKGRRLYFRKSDLARSFSPRARQDRIFLGETFVAGIKAKVFRDPMHHERTTQR